MQPTARGQEIHRLALTTDGKIVAAFGDYQANNGPLAIEPFDIASSTLDPSEVTLHTEATWRMRPIGTDLYVPYIDPQQGPLNPENGQYAVRHDDGTWDVVTNVEPVPVHVFDVAQTVDGLWLFGSTESPGKGRIWRSEDDAATWSASLTVDETVGQPADFARFYAVAQFGDDLVAYYLDGAVTRAWHWAEGGSAWTDLGALAAPVVGTPCSFAFNGLTFWVGLATGPELDRSAPSTPVALVHPDNDASEIAFPPDVAVYDAATDGTHLYLLTSDMHLWQADNTGTWTDLLIVDDDTVRCLAVADGIVYMGTSDSRLCAVNLP